MTNICYKVIACEKLKSIVEKAEKLEVNKAVEEIEEICEKCIERCKQ